MIIVTMLFVGVPLLWAGLLNLRDRRQARLLDLVLDQFSPLDLRGRIAVQVRCGVLSPTSVVTIQIVPCSWTEVREIVPRLSRRLPPRVRLEVTGWLDGHFLATFVIAPRRRRSFPGAPRPSLAVS